MNTKTSVEKYDNSIAGLIEVFGPEIIGAWERNHTSLLGGRSIGQVNEAYKNIRIRTAGLGDSTVSLSYLVGASILAVLVVWLACSGALRQILMGSVSIAGTVLLSILIFRMGRLGKEIRAEKIRAGNVSVSDILEEFLGDAKSLGRARSASETVETLVQLAHTVLWQEARHDKARQPDSGVSDAQLTVMGNSLSEARISFEDMFRAATTQFDGLVRSSRGEIFHIAELRLRKDSK